MNFIASFLLSSHRCFQVLVAALVVSACTHQTAMVEAPAAFLEDAKQCDPMMHTYRNAVVKLMDFQGSTASGVVIERNRILTVAHALNGHTLYADINGIPTQTRILSVNEKLDLAYLAVDTQSIPPVQLSSSGLNVGEPVWVAGFPLAKHQRVSTGYFQSLERGRFYTSVHINQGTSGGALMHCENGYAKLAGIVHGFVGLHRNGTVVNIGDSTSVSTTNIKAFLQSQKRAQGNLISSTFSG